jgi:hypothetical protein
MRAEHPPDFDDPEEMVGHPTMGPGRPVLNTVRDNVFARIPFISIASTSGTWAVWKIVSSTIVSGR